MSGKIGWLFGLGHGHFAQFHNFRECFPAEEAHRAEWIGLPYDRSGDLIAQLPFLPTSLRLRRHQLWHARNGLARSKEWDALVIAGHQISYLPLMRRFP